MKIILTENQIRNIIREDATKLGYVGDSPEYAAQLRAGQKIDIGRLGSLFAGKSSFGRTPKTGGDSAVQNMSGSEVAQTVKSRLMKDLGWTDFQAAALLGIIQCESGFKVDAVNRREKAGTYAGSAANGSGYGAGLIQWSLKRKQTALAMLQQYNLSHGIDSHPNSIEECSLDDQITMVELELKNGNLNNLVKQTTNVRDALKVLYTYFVAGWNPNANQIPSEEKLYALVSRYSAINGGRDGFTKRLSAAQNFC